MSIDTDVQRILAYRTNGRFLIPYALAVLLFGLFGLAFGNPDAGSVAVFLIATALGTVLMVVALWRLVRADTPVLVLSPEGLFHQARKGTLRIPWSEICDVAPFEVPYKNTRIRSVMIVLSPEFFEAHRRFLPGLRSRAADRSRAIYLDYLSYPVRLEEILEPIRARLQAFGKGASEPAAREVRFGRDAIHISGRRALDDLGRRAAVTHGGRTLPGWKKALVAFALILPLVPLSNILGLLEAAGQAEARAARIER